VLLDSHSLPYYSLYSMSEVFRKRWLPKAMDPRLALSHLRAFQMETGRDVVLHWAFIHADNEEHSNDKDEDIDQIVQAVADAGVKVRFNLVRYNPLDHRHGVEPIESRLTQLFLRLTGGLSDHGLLLSGSKIVQRVGFDVKASCGMFVEKEAADVPM